MNKTTINLLLLFVLLILGQVLLFNSLVLFGVAIPMVFIYLIITIPVTYSVNLVMTIGFITGLCVDVFSDTLGVNALCSTIVAFVRRPLFHLYIASDNDLAEQSPSLRNMGVPSFLKYSLTMAVAYCAMYFTVEALQIFDFKLYILRILCSSIYTFILIYAIANLISGRREKRL